MGTVLMIARFSDVITDPIIGSRSDKTRTRIGRRKPWLILGVPMMMLATYLLFVPPNNPSIWYFLLCVVFIYLASTVISIPYSAWGAELSGNYNERSRITALREQFTLAGYLIAVSIPMILSFFGRDELKPARPLSPCRESSSAPACPSLSPLPCTGCRNPPCQRFAPRTYPRAATAKDYASLPGTDPSSGS